MKNKPLLISLLLLFILTGIVYPDNDRMTNVGTTAASFLEIGIGSRAVGMGGAFVAIANDGSTLYWNPAGISRLTQGEILFETVDWLVDTRLNFLATVIPLGRFGTIGAFLTSVNIPRMKVRTMNYPDGTGEYFNSSDLSFGLSYARNLTDRFSIGFNTKYISERIWHERAHTIAFDIGTLYNTGLGSLKIGAAITNFGPSMKMEGSDLIIYHDTAPLSEGNNDRIMGELQTDSWPLPLNMQFGVSYDFLDTKVNKFTMAMDAFHPINNTESINAGFEWSTFDFLFLRGGFKAIGQQDSEEGFTIGGGLKYRLFGQSSIKIDYAYADFGRLESVQRFTLFLQL